MSLRNVHVLHLLVTRRVASAVQFLVFPHPKWVAEASGRPALALPSKKHAVNGIAPAVEAILHDDLDLEEGGFGEMPALPGSRVELVSPTHHELTRYSLQPVLARVPVHRHAALARRLDGAWLGAEEALRREDLSPTARDVLRRGHAPAADWLHRQAEAPFGSPRDRDWTSRLLLVRDGDMNIFGSLLEEMKPLLHKRLMSNGWTRGLHPDEREDVLHESAIKALENLHTFDAEKGTALSWFWGIARNGGVNVLRGRNRRAVVSLSSVGAIEDSVGSTRLDPARLAQRREELGQAQRRLAQLLLKAGPQAQRIWEMRFVDQMPYAAIADELHLPLGTVATTIHRLRQQAGKARRGR
jgi:RNA polymerase sigma factor (sigma-70 family)